MNNTIAKELWPDVFWAEFLTKEANHQCDDSLLLQCIHEGIHLARSLEPSTEDQIGLTCLSIYWHFILTSILDNQEDLGERALNQAIAFASAVGKSIPSSWRSIEASMTIAIRQKNLPDLIEFVSLMEAG